MGEGGVVGGEVCVWGGGGILLTRVHSAGHILSSRLARLEELDWILNRKLNV